MIRALVAAGLLLVARAALLPAQVVDTTRADTLAADTTDYTGQFLKAQQDARRLIPVPRRVGEGALLPFRTRIVFNRDTILWHNAETLSDVLAKIPGVYLLRGGWAGRPELPMYQARGATSVEYVLDGMPYVPMGQDSVSVDPSMFPLSFYDRIEVERLPGLLRVYLFTYKHDRSVPYSRIGVSSGDLSIERYQGQLEKRSKNGLGFSLAFDHLGVPVQSGQKGDYSNTQGWIRLNYIPTSRFAVELQGFLNSPDREAVLCSGVGAALPSVCLSAADTLSRERRFSRKDLMGRMFWAARSDGLGPRLDILLGHSSLTDHVEKDSTLVLTKLEFNGTVIKTDTSYDTRDHQRGLTQAGAVVGYRLAAASLDGSLFYRSAWTKLDARARAGVAPSRWSSAGLEAVYQRHEANRSNAWLTARAGVTLPYGFSAAGIWRKGKEVALPAILDDEPQDIDDRSLTAGWKAGFVEAEVSYSWNAGYRAVGYAQYPKLATITPSGRTQWVTVNARLAPRQWLVVDGWYSTPQGQRPEGQPPTHSVINGTIQSKFLPTFKSGIFNVKLQATVENWSPGTLAHDSKGKAVELKGATQFRSYIGLQIGAFTAYYDRYNVAGTRLPYVPGLQVPRFASTFGVRWEFSN